MDIEISCSLLPLDSHHKKVLIARRSIYKEDFPGLWETIGGGLKDGESLEDCIRREVREEIGTDIFKLKQIGSRIIYDGKKQYMNVLFSGLISAIKEINLAEISEVKWIKENEINKHEYFPNCYESIIKGFAEMKKGDITPTST
jgi:8-oxo-dGTP pyrophosphatase MutT (NUDIX family)